MYADAQFVFRVLDCIHARTPIDVIIHGAALGADAAGHVWAKKNGVKTVPFPANWDEYGKRAGPLRNQQMLDFGPELVVAFPGGSGTADMVGRARASGLWAFEPARSALAFI